MDTSEIIATVLIFFMIGSGIILFITDIYLIICDTLGIQPIKSLKNKIISLKKIKRKILKERYNIIYDENLNAEYVEDSIGTYRREYNSEGSSILFSTFDNEYSKLMKFDKDNNEVYSKDSEHFEEERNYYKNGSIRSYINNEGLAIYITYYCDEYGDYCFIKDNSGSAIKSIRTKKTLINLKYNRNNDNIQYIWG